MTRTDTQEQHLNWTTGHREVPLQCLADPEKLERGKEHVLPQHLQKKIAAATSTTETLSKQFSSFLTQGL
jgi:hypothetical protein